jgi:AraC family transcriptional regulator
MLTLSAHRRHDQNPPHRHANDFVCMVLTGSFAERQENDWRDRRAGAYFVHRAGETHHDRFGPDGAVCLSLHFEQHETRPTNAEGHCSPLAMLAAHRLAFQLTASRKDELEVAALTAEILAELGPSYCLGRDDGDWIGKIVEAIADEPRRRWGLNELAVIAGRHPVHLAQAFRARTGLTLGTFQRLRRLVSLSLALRRDMEPLAMLASDFGYCDQSHMNAEFRAAFGMSPGRYRRTFH